MPAAEYDRNVFINCPFDDAYAPIFEAIVFAVHDAGFRPKCARERLDSSEVRLQKILSLISESRFSIHDLSRTELDDSNQLPRFNMPFELGNKSTRSADNNSLAVLLPFEHRARADSELAANLRGTFDPMQWSAARPRAASAAEVGRRSTPSRLE